MLNNTDILVLSSGYNTFVKDQVDMIAQFVRKVDVSVRYNPLFEISKFIPYLAAGAPFSIRNIIDRNSMPNNLDIMISKLYFIPIDVFRYKLGEIYFKNLQSKIRENFHYKIVHAHFIWPQGYVGMKLKSMYKIPLVITAHGFDVLLGYKNEVWRRRIISVLNQADRIICVGPYYTELLQKLIPTKKIDTIANGYDNKLFHKLNTINCRKKLDLPLNKKIVLNVAYFTKSKGQNDLILALKGLIIKRKDILCIIIGEGANRQNLESTIKKNHLEDYVKLIGSKSHKEIPIWMNACDVFVHPSYKESFGIVTIEALACGKPVVSTFNGGSEYIITSNDLGYLVNPKDVKNLQSKIEEAINKKWDENKILDYAKQYEWDNTVMRILEIYDELL